VLLRAIIGALASGGIAFWTLRVGALTRGGALAATLVGTVVVAAGWSWGVLLASFFVSSIALSRMGEPRKAQRVAGIVAKTGARDAWQVLANGGLFAGAAAAAILSPSSVWPAIGIGALSASAADTWGTEIGTLLGGEPRSIVSGRRVAAGASGGITLAGTAGTVGGAGVMALAAALTDWPVGIGVILVSGVVGAMTDSILGAVAQERFWCEACAMPTEQSIHRCGTITSRAGGFAGLNNDVVNLLCSLIGALVALVMS
jgi:uncharacterized protein (TIGR00297 family)